jgi:rhodanese-related sulfurtransferase
MKPEISTVTPEQLRAAQTGKQHPALLDGQTVAEYRAGHIPGAKLIPLEEPAPELLANHFGNPDLAGAHGNPVYHLHERNTRWCSMARLIALMPWNRSGNCPHQVKA